LSEVSALERAVEVMDRLRSPGGCPWDAEQTHASLAKYLLEETYETLEAIETDDLALLREELGDILLQVLFHARLAEEVEGGFSIEDVAGDLVAKLIERHPHVFGDESGAAVDADQVNENWERLKAAQKKRSSLVDGVPTAQPALALAAKLVSRVARAPLVVSTDSTNEIGDRLFALVQEAVAAGVDPETALRQTARAYRAAIIAAEAESDRPGGR
jgi:XTP/dITP diphosphohydrolase